MNRENETVEPFLEGTESTERSPEGNTATWKQLLRINKDLLPMKMMYFFFFAGYSCTFPYMPVFLRYVGISTKNVGIILGLQTIVKFIASPFWGAIADKFRKHKLVMMITLIVSSSVAFGTAFIPPARKKSSKELQMDCCLVCPAGKDAIGNLGSVGTPVNLIYLPSSDRFMFVASNVVDRNSFIRTKNGSCVNPNTDVLDQSSSMLSLNKNNSSLLLTVNLKGFPSCQSIRLEATKCGMYPTLTITNFATEIDCNSTQVQEVSICQYQRNVTPRNSDESHTFALLLNLILLASFFMVFETGIADACVVKYLEKIGRPRDYGKQRIFGGLGWGIFSILAGMANDKFEETFKVNKFLASFSLNMALILLTSLCVSKLHTSHLAATERPPILKNLAIVLSNFQVVSFFFVLVMNGTANGFIFQYLFMYLEDLGANNLLIGLCLAMSTVAEIPLMFISGYIIKKLSHEGVFILTFPVFSLRMFCYSLIPSAWYVLPVELLHGITFGIMWPAATSYVGIISPRGMAATVQGLASGLYICLGFVISGFTGGTVYAKYGAKKMFRVLSLLMLISGILFVVSNKVYGIFNERKKREEVELSELGNLEKDDQNFAKGGVQTMS